MGQGLYRKSFFFLAPLLSCQYLDAFALDFHNKIKLLSPWLTSPSIPLLIKEREARDRMKFCILFNPRS